MSALGQKQTCASQKVMSALPPKADMCSAQADVRFTPESGHSRLRLFALAYDFNRALGLHAVHQSSDRLCLYFRYFRGNTISSAAIDG